jgi:hypothetical protein
VSAYQNVVNAWMKADPAGAAAYAAILVQNPDLSSVVGSVANLWSQSDGVDALNWSESLPAGAAHDAAVSASVNNWASVDPAAAWNYGQSLPPSASTDQLLASVATTWSMKYPDEAMAALVASPSNSAAYYTAVQTTAKNWAGRSEQDAEQWVATLPAGATRDSAPSGVAASIVPANPQTAYQMALSISDDNERTTTVNKVMAEWKKRDPAAAAAAQQSVPWKHKSSSDSRKPFPTRKISFRGFLFGDVLHGVEAGKIIILRPDGGGVGARGGQHQRIREREFGLQAQACGQDGQLRVQVHHRAQLHMGDGLQSLGFASFARDPFENFVEAHRRDQQLVHALNGPGEEAGVRAFGEILDPPG